MKFIKRLFKKNVETVVEKQNCLTCKFNKGLYCNVGSYLAEQGKTGVCYEGELWQSKETNHDKEAI